MSGISTDAERKSRAMSIRFPAAFSSQRTIRYSVSFLETGCKNGITTSGPPKTVWKPGTFCKRTTAHNW